MTKEDELAERTYGKKYDELCEDRKRIIDKLIQIEIKINSDR